MENEPVANENIKVDLWKILEGVIPDENHENNQKLEFIKEKYSFMSYEDALAQMGSADDITKEHYPNKIKGLVHTKDILPEQCVFLKATREDGTEVFAVIGTGAFIKYRADFFSPAYFGGHGGNHDFNASELLGNLYLAVKSPKYLTGNWYRAS